MLFRSVDWVYELALKCFSRSLQDDLLFCERIYPSVDRRPPFEIKYVPEISHNSRKGDTE